MGVKDQVFLMIIPEYPTVDIARQFQEAINQKYHLYKILPKLHITIESIEVRNQGDIEIAKSVIREVCSSFKSFPIVINGFACFGPPFKSVHLHVVKTEPLLNLYQQIHNSLRKEGLVLREYPDGIQFHITIASSCFPGRDWTEEEYHQACEELKGLPLKSGFVLKNLELWYPDINPEERLVERFVL